MSIFDSITNGTVSLDDILGTALDVATKTTSKSSSKGSAYSSLSASNMLAANTNGLRPNAAPGQYEVTKSKAPVSVDPEELRDQWIRRLDNYSNIAARTGVKLK